jgi:hypothetical protein
MSSYEQVEQARQQETAYEAQAEALLQEMMGGHAAPAISTEVSYWFEETWKS